MELFKNGDQVSLSFKLPDQRSTAFVRATVYNKTTPGTPLIYTLPHVDNGLYELDVPLGVGTYRVVYEPFKDSGFTNRFRIYNDSEDLIRVENIQETITNEADRMIDLMDDSDGRATCL